MKQKDQIKLLKKMDGGKNEKAEITSFTLTERNVNQIPRHEEINKNLSKSIIKRRGLK